MTRRIVFTLTAIGMAPLALAQGMGGGGMGMGMGLTAPFADVDADGDGNITREELGAVVPEQVLERLFTAWDVDDSGGISADEYDNRSAAGMGG